jgi:hypothetical protein
MTDNIKKAAVLLVLLICAVIYFGSPDLLRGQGGLQEGTALSRWRPTRELPGVGYVGSSACAQCHTDHAAKFFKTPMAHALETVSDCEILVKRPRMTFRQGTFSYQILRQGNRSTYTVSDGTNTISEPILYCFGQGVAGQTYVFRHRGALYESRVSYFQELQNLDITILHPRAVPTTLEDALGRQMSAEGAKGCFSCHSTAALSRNELQLERLVPGVSCEACHGPGEKHLAAVKAKNFKDLQIFNPGDLDPFDLTQEFCGSCHMGFEQAIAMPDHGGINNLRFQPYRIFNSRAHFINDPRMSCTACHNPHDELKREASFYDSKCLACHLSDSKEPVTEMRRAAPCPVSTRQCVVCHMPKVEVPEMHFKFTDHWIRIVKAGEPVPR